MALFELSELASYLQQDLDTATATLLRDLATGDVQSVVKQTLFLVADDEVSLEVNPRSSEVTLPQRPVVDVTSVKIRGAEVTGWVWDGRYTVVAPSPWNYDPSGVLPELVGSTDADYLDKAYYSVVTVTYSHGSDDPAWLAVAKGVALASAARRYDNPTGLIQESIDDYQKQTGVDGASALTADEITRLRRAYGRRAFSVVSR